MIKHRNNFDLLRLFFAIFVLISHSYPLSGIPEDDILHRFTNGQTGFSGLGVKGFFIISGYLIFESLMRSKSWKDYMAKRVLRIYPAYLVVLAVAFIVGIFVSANGPISYLHDRSPYSYVIKNAPMLTRSQGVITGVFADNPYKDAINGSLWTIPYELLLYILLSLTFFIKQRKNLMRAVLIGTYVALVLVFFRYEDAPGYTLPYTDFEWHQVMHMSIFFLGGAVLAIMDIKPSRFSKVLFICSFALFITMFVAGKYFYFQFVMLPLVIITAGIQKIPVVTDLYGRLGDFSYGIYLYGFLVQQLLMHYYRFSCLQLMCLSIPVSILCGALSWHLVEKKALRLKQRFS